MTSIEWLQVEIDNKDMGEIPMWIYEFIEQAKEMHKQEIIFAFKDAQFLKVVDDKKRAENYYNETFKKD